MIPITWALIAVVAASAASAIGSWSVRGKIADAEVESVRQGYERAALDVEKLWLSVANKAADKARKAKNELDKTVAGLEDRVRSAAAGATDCRVPVAVGWVLDDAIRRGEEAARGTVGDGTDAAHAAPTDQGETGDVSVREWEVFSAEQVTWGLSCLAKLEHLQEREREFEKAKPKEVSP